MKWENRGHEFDTIGYQLLNIKRIYFYGIGGHIKEIFDLLRLTEKWFDVEMFFIDKNESVRQRGFEGHEILSPDQFLKKIKNDKQYLVVACPLGKVGKEIMDIVVSNGVNPCDVVTGYDFIYTLIPIYFLYKHDLLFFTSQNIVPSSACNLNCRECLNFNPYIDKPVVHSFEEVKSDIDIFFNAIDLIYRFQVTGGEPLLYPNLKQVLAYIKDNYSDKILRLETVTNGTIIPSDELCEFFAENDIYVFLDDYTLALSPEHKEIRCKIQDKFSKFGVTYHDNYVDRWFKIYPCRIEKCDCELVDFFSACSNPWATIENGSISACNYELYAQKAGLVNGDEKDFYDLTKYTLEKKKELLEFRLRFNERGYTSFCKKCAGFSVINDDLYYPAIQMEKKHEVDK